MSGKHEHPPGFICLAHSPLELVMVARSLAICAEAGYQATFSHVQDGPVARARVEVLVQDDIMVIGGAGEDLKEACFRLAQNVEELLANAGLEQLPEEPNSPGRMVN